MDCYPNLDSDCSNCDCQFTSPQLHSCVYIHFMDWNRYFYGILIGPRTQKCKSLNTKRNYFLAYAKDGFLHANCFCCNNNCRLFPCFKARFYHPTSSRSLLDFRSIGYRRSHVHTRIGYTLTYKSSDIFRVKKS